MNLNNKNLHLGCGAVYFDGWINVDLDSPLADMRLDLTQPLPFMDASASCVFSEHFIEHVTRKQAVDFLGECRRILMPGGVIRVSTPNLRFLIAAYLALEVGEWGDLWQPATMCSLMNEGMRSWGHQYLYDAEELVLIFKEAGFGSVVFQRYQESQTPGLAGLESRPFHHELIVEATKCDGVFVADFSVLRKDEQHWFQQYARLEALEQTIVDQATQLRGLEAEVAACGTHISGLEQTIADQATQLRNVEAAVGVRDLRIAELQQSIHAMHSSTSWRITSPLRYLALKTKGKKRKPGNYD